LFAGGKMTTADTGADFGSLLDSEEDAPHLERGAVLAGRVVALDAQGAFVDLGRKRDGVVPHAELERLAQEGAPIEVGQTVTVVVIGSEDRDGNLMVSISQGLRFRDWVVAEQLLASGEVWEGAVTGHNRGGLIVQFGEVQAFVPASQVMDLPHNLPEAERSDRFAAFVGRRMGFKVIEVDRHRRRLVLSERRAHKEYREHQRANLLADLAEGQVRQGVVTALRDFGAFVDLGGADGLIHISELAWRRVKHPSEVLSVGQEVEVEVLKVDRAERRIGLSLKRRQPDPWSQAGQRFRSGQIVSGTVTRVVTFGAFVDLGEGVEGLLHSSRWAGQTITEGTEVEVQILRVEPERQRISLALPARETPSSTGAAEADGAAMDEEERDEA
jgi:small subunit ribosomal protein S1